MQITQLMTSHCIMSCQSISYIVETLDEYLTRFIKNLALRYIISDAAKDFIFYLVLATELFKTHYAV